MKNTFNKAVLLNGNTYKFHDSVKTSELELLKCYIESDNKPFVKYQGKNIIIRLSGILNSHSKTVRKMIKGIKIAKSLSHSDDGVITVKLQSKVKLSSLVFK